jgi:DNA-binding response OmpR family regulator
MERVMPVLIADGEDVFLEVVQRYISHHGHEVIIATKGLVCIASMRRYVPDLVVFERELLWGGSDGVRLSCNKTPRVRRFP